MEYKSCQLLEHGICFYSQNICACCYAPQDGWRMAPYIFPYYNGQKINEKALIYKQQTWRENAKQGRLLRNCQNCYKLETKQWPDEDYIDNVYITHFDSCNLKCIYCINPPERADKTYNVVPVLDDLKEKGILRKNCEFHIGGGEFTIYPECDEIINKYVITGFSKHLAVATNGIRFSQALFNAMDLNRAAIMLSVDCGTSGMYKKIRGVDAFDKLKESLKLYTQSEKSRENTYLKYIVLPKINDNKKEFKKFLEFTASFGISGVKIDIDGHYCRKNFYKPEKRVKDFLSWTIQESVVNGFDVETFQFYNQCYLTE